MTRRTKNLLLIIVVFILAALFSLPEIIPLNIPAIGLKYNLVMPRFSYNILGMNVSNDKPLKKGLDIQGGIQVVLKADMSSVSADQRIEALKSTNEIISRRVNMYGISEANVFSAINNNDYKIMVELPGITNSDQALSLVGQTAKLDFRLLNTQSLDKSMTVDQYLDSFTKTELSGEHLKNATAQMDPQTGQFGVSLQFNQKGKELFAKITKENIGKALGIFVDGSPVTVPRIQAAIPNGTAQITGNFSMNKANQLAIQLKAGALPVSIEVVEQRKIGASLGEQSVQKSIVAGLIGLLFVCLFMMSYYGFQGFIAVLALIYYAVLTIGVYKLIGVTLTLPGIAGLLLSIGMAVDSNILSFERIKEEMRKGENQLNALKQGFGKAWESIKDANIVTIITALILINPLNFGFLNNSGMVRGFGVTLLIGVIISTFTGVVVSKILMLNIMPLFIKEIDNGNS